MTRSGRLLMVVFSVLGLAASTVSTVVHYKLLTQPGFSSFCDVNATVSCTQAYLSAYGTFLGIPVAIEGLVFFAFTLLLTLTTARRDSDAAESATTTYLFAASTVAFGFVLYLAWASFARLGTFCIVCGTTYLSVIGLFITSASQKGLPVSQLPARLGRDLRGLVLRPAALVTAIVFVLSATTVIAVFPKHGGVAAREQSPPARPVTDDDRTKLAQWWELQPKVDLPISNDGAKVLVVKFNDYECPACRMTHFQYGRVLSKYVASGAVRVVVKDFPLEQECNPSIKGGDHLVACEAAAAVVMARAKGTADKMQDWLFEHQGPPLLTVPQIKDAAGQIGGVTDYDAQYPAALEAIRNDARLGGKLDIHRTPTFFINGRRLPELLQPQYFEVIIELELKKALGSTAIH